MRFHEQVAIVTGAASGIAEATAARIAAEGGIVIAVDRDEPRLRRAVQAIQAADGRAHARPVDVLDPSGVAEVVRTVLEELGRIDILINGVGGSTVIARPDAEVGDLTLDQWRQLLAFNLEVTGGL